MAICVSGKMTMNLGIAASHLGWNQQHILCGCGLCIISLLCWGGNPEWLFPPRCYVENQWIAQIEQRYSWGGYIIRTLC